MNAQPLGVLFARLTSLLFFTPLGLLAVGSAQAMQNVEERADLTLPDIAAVHMEPGEAPVILYNPMLCQHAGRDLCDFYRYHEYGHLALQHHTRKDISLRQKEGDADRWAAKHAPLRAVIAAYLHFLKGGGSSPAHGESQVRAARLLIRTQSLAALNAAPRGQYRLRDQFARAF